MYQLNLENIKFAWDALSETMEVEMPGDFADVELTPDQMRSIVLFWQRCEAMLLHPAYSSGNAR